ncbi:gamma-glutamyl-gamma-aminobutyrate hydrolase family protein [Arenimonas composti]|uniref:Uncharacterized protein n=1 Tax=Arenimonas composti TR7-09 = DSM 18010 TaxID=1121013 RepID=A0A091B6H0_9GAMM|nr:gamma-glutamyl-gamma-aminobutyrate hydrolase family protein [Arenimonas composti]KFN48263.1 hypothetical protein P873_01520 [Arenimonas composti TR7-09 = DSM 18010]
MNTPPLLIGISPRTLREVPVELGFRGKTLEFLENSVPHWLLGLGALPVMVPTVEIEGPYRPATATVGDYARQLDALILQGGSDIHPQFYGEPIRHARGRIDPRRDRFELDLLAAFVEAGKPVLGICRGLQLINVAYGGNLYQDLHEDAATSSAHHVQDLYDEHLHPIEFAAGGWLRGVYGNDGGIVNSIHHQGVRELGRGLRIEARADDGVVEAVRAEGDGFVLGVQWHPEFHDGRWEDLLPTEPLLQAFFAAAAARRERG